MSVVHRKLIGSRCFLLSLLPKASISSVGSSLLSSFIESQPWQRMLSSTLQTFEQVTHAGIEQIMESPPYGLEVSASLCLPSIDGVECTISDTWHVLQENIDLVLNICTEDLYYDMLEREKEYVSPHTYSPNAGYLPYRRYLVDWMSDVGEQCRLHNSTIHVSVLFLDKIFRSTDIPRSQWQLLATACITVAAKYEEAEEHCPHIPELLRLTKLRDVGHNSLSFRDGELEVLHHLGWKLRAFPPIHIVGYILSKGACFVDDLWQGRALIPKIPKYIKKYAEFFCNLTLQEYSFQQYLPSQLGAASVMASRVALQVEPRWRNELTRITGYEEHEILPIFQHIWSYYEEQFPGHGSRSISPRSVAAGCWICIFISAWCRHSFEWPAMLSFMSSCFHIYFYDSNKPIVGFFHGIFLGESGCI